MQPKPEAVPPPPALFLAAFAAGLLIHRIVPLLLPDAYWVRACGIVLMLAGAVVATAAVAELVQARTAVHPGRPASAFVTSGPYRFTRNPIYLSASCLYAGLAMVFRLGWPLIVLPAGMCALQNMVIKREERYLTARFGVDYINWTKRVRRWL